MQREAAEPGSRATTVDDAELIYVGDPMCSWCWAFAPVLDEVQARYRVRVRTVVGGLRTGGAAQPMDPAARVSLGRYWRQVAERTGQPFTTASLERGDWVYDTEPSCMAVVAMRGLRPDKTLRWMARLQRAFYVEGVDITDLSVFPALAGEFGMDEARFASILGSDATRRGTWADFEEARSLGVAGFPTLLLRAGEQVEVVTRGYAPREDLEPVLARWLATRDQRATADLTCDVDGGLC
ncbi:MAG: DsbA family protein [Actinomycetota bacterium]|nr:DsbA family protein [Actinomycetota bacterium]